MIVRQNLSLKNHPIYKDFYKRRFPPKSAGKAPMPSASCMMFEKQISIAVLLLSHHSLRNWPGS